MPIINETKKSIIIKNFKICSDFGKFTGLMFSRKKENALVFKFGKEKIISLHMLFVFYPIDVLFLDKNKNVVDMKENFRPFAFYNSKKRAMYTIELPNGIIKKTRTDVGDKIEIWSN